MTKGVSSLQQLNGKKAYSLIFDAFWDCHDQPDAARNCVELTMSAAMPRVYKNVFLSAGKLVDKGSPAVAGQVSFVWLVCSRLWSHDVFLAAFVHIAEDHTPCVALTQNT